LRNGVAGLTTLQAQFTTLQGSVTTLQGQVTIANANITTLQTAISALQTLTQIQSNAAALQGSLLNAISAVNASFLSPAQKTALIAGLNIQLAEAQRQQAQVAILAAGSPAEISARIPQIITLITQANVLPAGVNNAIRNVQAAGVSVPNP